MQFMHVYDYFKCHIINIRKKKKYDKLYIIVRLVRDLRCSENLKW